MDAAGNMVVGWTQYLPDPVGDNETDLYAQRLNAAGAPIGGVLRLDDTTDGQELLGELAMDATGNFVTVWESYAGYDTYGRCFTAGGAPRGAHFPLDNEGELTFAPDVAMANDGGFVAVWSEQSYGDAGYDYQIYARLFAADCRLLGDPILVNNINTGEEREPAIAMDAAGNFVVAWVGDDSYWSGIFARRFNRDGAPLGGQFRVNQRQRFGQYEVEVAMDGAGRFTVAYVSEVERFNLDVLFRRYNANGVPLGSEARPHPLSPAAQYLPKVAARVG